MPNQFHEDNRLSWNAATEAHNSHKGDQAAFLRDGSTLFPEELELLGPLDGLDLLHLQCNSGQDTLSLARHGAIVTGVDISDTAIAFAQQLSIDTGIGATFERADVIDWMAQAARDGRRFDIVFCSYGALVWLSDLKPWAAGIASLLKPGGRFAVIEFHPAAYMFDEHWQHRYSYFGGGQPQTNNGVGDYVAAAGEALAPWGYHEGVVNFRNPHRAHEFQWTLSDVVMALIDGGLLIEQLREYPYANGAKLYERMDELPGRRMVPPPDVPSLPLMFGLTARKP
jgi:SAM-dependent methyltransferase